MQNITIFYEIHLDVRYLSEPKLEGPTMVAAWPGMGYIAKISADYLRRRLNARLFAEVVYYHNVLLYNSGVGELMPIRHRFYASSPHNLIICVGDAQPSIPEESIRLAEIVIGVAEKYGAKRIYTMAAYPSEYENEPKVYGIYNYDRLKSVLDGAGVKVITDEGAVNGLNGVLIGIARMHGLEGICLMGDIKYANVPQHLSSKAVLEKLASILSVEIDVSQLEKRAKKIDASIKKRLEIYEEKMDLAPVPDKKLGYIS